MAKATNVTKIKVADEDENDGLTHKLSDLNKTVKTEAVKNPAAKKSLKRPAQMAGKKPLKKNAVKTLKEKPKKIIKKPVKAVEIKAPDDKIIVNQEKEAPKDQEKIRKTIDKMSVLKEIEKNTAEQAKKPVELKTDGQKSEVKAEAKPEISLAKTSSVKDFISKTLKEEESKKAEALVDGKVKSQRHIKLYKRIALSFIFLTIALLAVVAYFSFVKVTIILIPNQERLSNNMIADITDKEKNMGVTTNAIPGVVTLVKMSEENTFQASGTEVIGEEAVGKVKIINNYTKNQPLVATTRLLSPDGLKLYRLKNTVNIPAGGEVEAEIYADDPSPESAIGPSKFTFPGLWAGLQNQIYAESQEPVVYRQKLKRNIVQADIDNAIAGLKQKLLDKAKIEVNETYKDYSQIIYKVDEGSINSEVDGKVGEEKENFKVSMTANVVVIAFVRDDVVKLAQNKFLSSLPENKEIIEFDQENIVFSLNNFNGSESTAAINVAFEGKVTLKGNAQIVEVDKILGLNSKELDAYLKSLNDVAGFEVKFYPSFIKRVPKLVDRINIEIKK